MIEKPMHLRALLQRCARQHCETVAVQDERQALTWAGLDSRVSALARALAARGIRAGERVAVIAKNRWEYAALYFACAEVGAVLVALNWRLKPGELLALLADSQAVALFADSELAAPAEIRLRCVLSGEGSGHWLPFAQLLREEAPAITPNETDPSDVVIQMYTSGTTGVPKGAMLTHQNVCSLAAAWAQEIDLRPDVDRFLQVTPLFHVGGMLMLMSTAFVGATLLLHSEFQPDLALRALREDGATHSLFVPAMLQWLLLQPEAEQTSYADLRVIAYGAAPASPELLRRAHAVFGCGFLQGYGLTETAGVLTVLRPDEHHHEDPATETARLGSIGRAIGCCEVRVVNERGQAVTATGEVGEIEARGENIFVGYWELPDDTSASFRDGWFRTGDLARIDADGFITLVDRIKDMILVGGENVYPSEIERVLIQHVAVGDAAVIGIPHDVWGEEVLALVQLARGAVVNDRELIRHCRTQLARFKCPTQVRFLDQIPRNAAGKCEKAALREPYWEGRGRKI